MATILLVGNDRGRAGGLRAPLRSDRHQVTWIRSPEQWSAAEREIHPDLIVVAVEDPAGILFDSPQAPRGFPAPLLIVQHQGDPVQEAFLEDRLVDRLESPFGVEDLLARADALMKVHRVAWRRHAGSADTPDPRGEAGVIRRTLAALFASPSAPAPRPSAPYLEVAARVAEWADRRDTFEPGHPGRVAALCASMALSLGLAEEETDVLLRAALLHDIGKLSLPVGVLRQRGPLDETQMRLVRTHAERGAALLEALDPENEAARVILFHHERPDGQGYYGKPFDSVPRGARLLGVAEAYDAMTASRYRPPLSTQQALAYLAEHRGARFDAEAVDALVESVKPRPTRIPI